MTKVKFLYEKDGTGVFAFFPEEHYFGNGHTQYRDMLTSYAHTGQHSACSPEYADGCKEAPINECMDLLNELINYGDGKQYNDLQIMNSWGIQYGLQY